MIYIVAEPLITFAAEFWRRNIVLKYVGEHEFKSVEVSKWWDEL